MEMHTIFLAERDIDTHIWSYEVDNVELLAGMLAASVDIANDMNYEAMYDASVQGITTYPEYYFDTHDDVSAFRVISEVLGDDISRYTTANIDEGKFGIWLLGRKRFYYSLYTFQTNSFFQGIVSICNMFQVDFRNYIYGYPFDYYGNQYTLDTYVMAPYLISQDAFDIDDNETTEADDENIIEVLARTDDVITLKDTDI